MKHLLNNLSEEEKNSIREQYIGGKKIVIENFNKLVKTVSGDIKPLLSNINEQNEYHVAPTGWNSMEDFFDSQNIKCGNDINLEGGREGSTYRLYVKDKNDFIKEVKNYYKKKCNNDLRVSVYIDLSEEGLPELSIQPSKIKII